MAFTLNYYFIVEYTKDNFIQLVLVIEMIN